MKFYDYLLKFLLVGDSDVGKEELFSGMEDGVMEFFYFSIDGKDCRRVFIDLYVLFLLICIVFLISFLSFIIVVIFKY